MSISIRMDGVNYQVGGRTILNEFSLNLSPGENRTILGVSGSGKTTILKLLLGLLKPQQGGIFLGDVNITTSPESAYREQRKKVAIVFQGAALFDSMTVGENVGYRLLEQGGYAIAQVESIVREKLSFVGIEHTLDLYPSELSGGMKKRVAIARALAASPEFIFFDEPTTGLDPIGVYNICSLLRRLQNAGVTTLTVTHDLETAFTTSERFTFLHEARAVFDGDRHGLQTCSHPAVQEFLAPTRASLFG